MSEPRFGGVLDVQDSTVFTSDRFTFTLLLNGFDLPRSQPSAVNPNSNTRKIVIAVEPLSAPTTVAGLLRGNWEAAPEDDVELIIDPHGVPFTREDFRYEDSAFISNFTLGLQEGATEFTLTVRLQQKDGKAPRPDQFPVIIESIDFNFAAAP